MICAATVAFRNDWGLSKIKIIAKTVVKIQKCNAFPKVTENKSYLSNEINCSILSANQ